jgi:hypothetical protein
MLRPLRQPSAHTIRDDGWRQTTPVRRAAAALAAFAVAAIAAWSAAAQAVHSCAEAKRAGAVDAAARLEPALRYLPASGPSVEVLGHGIPLVGYLADAASVAVVYEQGMADADLRRRAHRAFTDFVLAQQLLAPRVLVLPSSPLFGHAQLLLGNYADLAAMPALPGDEYEQLLDAGNGIAVWRRRR